MRSEALKRVEVGAELVKARRARNLGGGNDRRTHAELGYSRTRPRRLEPDLVRLGMLRPQRARPFEIRESERAKLGATRPVSRIVTTGITILLSAVGAGVTTCSRSSSPSPAGAMGLGAVLGLIEARVRTEHREVPPCPRRRQAGRGEHPQRSAMKST